MQFMKCAIFLAALVTSPVGAVPNEATASQVAQLASNFKDLDSKVSNVNRALESYNGGLLGALQVANAVQKAHRATTTARKNVGRCDDFNITQGAQAVDAYSELHPHLLDALRSAKDKAPIFRKAGLGYVAQGMVANLYVEEMTFDRALKDKLLESDYQEIASFTKELERAVQDTIASYQD